MTFEATYCETGGETRTFWRCKSFSQQGDLLQHRHWMGCYRTLKGFLSAEEGRCLERQPYWSWLSLSPLSARNIFIFNKVSAESLYENILHECKILHRKCSGCVWFKWHFRSFESIVQQQLATGNVCHVIMSWSGLEMFFAAKFICRFWIECRASLNGWKQTWGWKALTFDFATNLTPVHTLSSRISSRSLSTQPLDHQIYVNVLKGIPSSHCGEKTGGSPGIKNL